MIRRREFITLLGGAAAWPLAVRAQQAAMPVIGFLTSLGRNDRPNLTDAFRRGLSETGFVEGRDLAIEYRFAENQHDRLPAMAADLVGRKVAVIAATGGPNSVLAAKDSTSTVPIVFTSGGDPVRAGFVTSLNRPGGNITGISWFGARLSGKALGLLHELIPNAAVFAMMVNPNNPESEYSPRDAQEAARMFGRQVLVFHAGTPSEIDTTFATLKNETLAMAHASLGLVSLHRNNFDAAIPELEQAVQLGTNSDPTNYYLLGLANQNAGHPDKAVPNFEKCAAIKGTSLTSTCTVLLDQAKKDAESKAK